MIMFEPLFECGHPQLAGKSDIGDKMAYTSIVFMQGDEADEPLYLLTQYGSYKAIEYLSQRDNGDIGTITDELGEGSQDTVIRSKEYILVYNLQLGYIGLSRVI